MLIRNYHPSEYDEIKRWWDIQMEPAPRPGLLPEESTFVLENDGHKVFSICVYLTNTKELAYIENFVRNPFYNGKRDHLAQCIVNHAYDFAASKGFKRVICFSYRECLKNRYQELGMIPKLHNLTSFVKEL